MNSVTKITKKVPIPWSLKHFFAPASHEFGQITFEKKVNTLRAVVLAGFSVYDLSERFRKDRSDRYSHEDMHSALTYYISTLIFEVYPEPFVGRYYEDVTDEVVAADLDVFLREPISQDEFTQRLMKKLNIPTL